MVSGNKIFSKLDEGTSSEGIQGNWKAKYPNQINPKIKNKRTNLTQNLEYEILNQIQPKVKPKSNKKKHSLSIAHKNSYR